MEERIEESDENIRDFEKKNNDSVENKESVNIIFEGEQRDCGHRKRYIHFVWKLKPLDLKYQELKV